MKDVWETLAFFIWWINWV